MKLATYKKRLTLQWKDRHFLTVKNREMKIRKYLVQVLFLNSAQSTDRFEVVFLTVLNVWQDTR